MNKQTTRQEYLTVIILAIVILALPAYYYFLKDDYANIPNRNGLLIIGLTPALWGMVLAKFTEIIINKFSNIKLTIRKQEGIKQLYLVLFLVASIILINFSIPKIGWNDTLNLYGICVILNIVLVAIYKIYQYYKHYKSE